MNLGSRTGFEWALEHSLLSHQANNYTHKEAWLKIKKATPVRIQWDPERDLHLQALNHRAIQIGLTNEAVGLYVNEWIQDISDITELATEIHSLVENNNIEAAQQRLPVERDFPVSNALKKHLGA